MGRVGVITHRERHDGGFNIVHIKDAIDNSFATRETNVFVIGNEKPWISLPKGKGVKVRQWSCSTRVPESMLIFDSCRLQRREIVVVHMQLRATRLGGNGQDAEVRNSLAQPAWLQILVPAFKKGSNTRENDRALKLGYGSHNHASEATKVYYPPNPPMATYIQPTNTSFDRSTRPICNHIRRWYH